MKRLPLFIFVIGLISATSCIYDDYDSSECIPRIVELKVTYDRQWEFSHYLEGLSQTDWQKVWSSLDFTCTYNELDPAIPDGLRTIVYDDDDAMDIRNIPPMGGCIYYMGDDPSILIYNNDTEYNVIVDQDEATEANVRTREMDRPTYNGSIFAPDATTLTTMPDVLYHCYIPVISWQTVNDTMKVNARMEPLVYTYAIRFGFTYGEEYVAIARGALAGMAIGAWLWDGDLIDKRVSVGFDAQLVDGAIEAYVNSFGHPMTLGDTYGLVLEMRLKNGVILDFDYDITDQMNQQPCGGVILIEGIEIPDSIGQQPAGGGFDVTVDGWGDFEDIPIEL